ncbi:MAG TPA: Sip1-related alpha-galactosidase, partial [Candidatus Synoicihabitans sp.]|nr:Sip1-related alpha-galactosidase [Candidatus Synoicihabitans sp.]
PRRPETHGLHLYTNAQVGAWFGEFMHPDWDMFQSGHEWGAYHAAGRAVSGAPIYVSDKPGTHDFGLLRQLVCSDGSALLADDPGRPTVDCLFCDQTRQPVPLKIFNRNGPRGVVGLFNAQYHPEHDKKVTVDGTVAPADVPTLEGPAFAAFAQRSGRVWQCGRDDVHAVRLAEREWEIVSYAPITRGVAVIGLADKLNSGGAIIAERWRDEQTLEVELRDGGELLGWSQHAPRAVEAGGIRVAHTFDPASGTLRATSRTLGRQTVVIRR